MRPDVRDWHAVALAKLTSVMGPRQGLEIASAVLAELAIDRIRSAAELRTVAAALSARGGFAAAVGGLLAVHAAMYDDAPARHA